MPRLERVDTLKLPGGGVAFITHCYDDRSERTGSEVTETLLTGLKNCYMGYATTRLIHIRKQTGDPSTSRFHRDNVYALVVTGALGAL